MQLGQTEFWVAVPRRAVPPSPYRQDRTALCISLIAGVAFWALAVWGVEIVTGHWSWGAAAVLGLTLAPAALAGGLRATTRR